MNVVVVEHHVMHVQVGVAVDGHRYARVEIAVAGKLAVTNGHVVRHASAVVGHREAALAGLENVLPDGVLASNRSAGRQHDAVVGVCSADEHRPVGCAVRVDGPAGGQCSVGLHDAARRQ